MITIMPESKDNILALRLSDTFTSEDYNEIVLPQLEALTGRWGDNLRVMLYLEDDAKEVSLSAFLDDLEHGFKHHSWLVAKLAVVGHENKLKKLAGRIDSKIKHTEMESWPHEKVNEAWTWLTLNIV